jgi:hypothetical protein
MHPMVLLVDKAHVEARFSLFGDTCIVCAKHNIALEIILKHPMVHLGDEAQVEAHFSLFRDSTNLDAR